MGKNKSKSTLGIILLGLIIAAAVYVNTSSTFEKDAPVITMENNGYWNLKKPLKLHIDDESGVKAYKVTFKSSKGESTLAHEQLIDPEKSLKLEVKPPRSAFALKDNEITISVEVRDASSWNFLKGNTVIKKFHILIDKRRPNTSIVSNSYGIKKGGSALVIFKVTDENLKDIYIETNTQKKFKPQAFYKEGYYISLMAWPITSESFEATIVAEDNADNIKKTHIPLYLKAKKYKVSNIKITDEFLSGKIADLAEEFQETQGVYDPIEQFKIINETVREKNEKLIHTLSSIVSQEQVDDFNINKMYPLKNAKVVASFGDHRNYLYKGEKVSESYHLGLDLASNAMASIKPQNGGKVVYADYNGLYGNMPMLDHGLGLYTIYGHCSSMNVHTDDETSAKMDIANTGKSGYAMGDHLHFGVLVQGVEVRPEEWMDTQWIKLNITDVINESKKIINKS
ncbi:MAG: M23 family metallopeptidase [Helicobacteraceae bacterium]|nr:M23 family metallopeptidase [Candidatus Sulfurimonas ponti]MBL6973886.1 M23 family metallopeptidase [Sulfurimonas sp.]